MDDNENDPFAKLGRLADDVIKARRAELDRLRAGEDLGHLEGQYEPVPVAKGPWPGPYLTRKPFGSPPDEPVEIDGDVPWELRDDDAEDD